MKFGFVILNFLTAQEAIKAAKSILNLNSSGDEKITIYIVDNGSSLRIVQEIESAFSDTKNISLITNKENLGFARGNNVGITAAVEDGCDIITCLNNDVEFSVEQNFFGECKKLLGNKNIGIIGPKIIDANGNNQNPFLTSGPSDLQKEYRKKIYTTPLGKLKYWLTRFYLPKLKRQPLTPISQENKSEPRSGEYYALHGSVLIFTPSFFEHYSGFDPNTFLYGEELILAEMLKKVNLTCYYTNTIKAFHAEDVSTDIYLKNKSKEKFCLKHEYDSIRHLVKTYY